MSIHCKYVSQLKNIIFLLILFVAFAACIIPTLTVKPIYVEQMIMTHGINADSEALDEVDVFKPDVGRIYSFARVPAKANEKLILKWYYQNELIGAVDNIVSDQGQIYWYLERPELFPQGQYRVELFDKTVHLKSKTFKVEK